MKGNAMQENDTKVITGYDKMNKLMKNVYNNIDSIYYEGKDLLEAINYPQKAIYEFHNVMMNIESSITGMDSWHDADSDQVLNLFNEKLNEYLGFIFENRERKKYFRDKIHRKLSKVMNEVQEDDISLLSKSLGNDIKPYLKNLGTNKPLKER